MGYDQEKKIEGRGCKCFNAYRDGDKQTFDFCRQGGLGRTEKFRPGKDEMCASKYCRWGW